MLGLHLPTLDHVTELSDAICDKLLLVAVTLTDNFPEIVCGALLKVWVLGKFPELADDLKLFLTNFF